MEQRIRFWNIAYWVCFGLYVIAYFLPSYGGWGGSGEWGGDTMPGYICAYMSIVMIFNPLMLLGNLANISVILSLFFRLLPYNPARPLLGGTVTFLIFAFIGTIFWVFFTGASGLLIGYFLWTFTVIGMAVAHFMHRLLLSRHTRSQTETDIMEHLIGEDER